MYRKLSNIASSEDMEEQIGLSLKYPNLHHPSLMINGLSEANLCVIIADEPNTILFSIWGILPSGYEGDWEEFQDIKNTLCTPIQEIGNNKLVEEAIFHRRCLIIITGYFTQYLHNDDIYPYYVHLPLQKTFTLAGIYNQLEDGFNTCSILIGDADSYHRSINNLDNYMPKIIDEARRADWLLPNQDVEVLREIITQPSNLNSDLRAFPIAKELYKKDISYETMLEPTYYEGLPTAKRNT